MVFVSAASVQYSDTGELCSGNRLERLVLAEEDFIVEPTVNKGEELQYYLPTEVVTLEFWIDGSPVDSPFENYFSVDGEAVTWINGRFVGLAGGTNPTTQSYFRYCSQENYVDVHPDGLECGHNWVETLREGRNVVHFVPVRPTSSVAVAAFYCSNNVVEVTEVVTDVPEYGAVVAVTTAGAAALAALLLRRKRKK